MKVFVASSRKYYDQVKEIKAKLDAIGIQGFYPYFELVGIEDDEEKKKQATMAHFPEIDQIDALYIVASNGYVGFSVAIETAYAFAKGKEIISSEPIAELAVRALVTKVMSTDEFVAYCNLGSGLKSLKRTEIKLFKKEDAVERKISDSHSVFNYLTADDSERVSVAIGSALDHNETTKTESDRAYFVLEGELIINDELIGHPGDVIFIPSSIQYNFKGTFKVVVINSPPFKVQSGVRS